MYLLKSAKQGWVLWVAKKYIFQKDKRNYLNFISWLSLLGIWFGVTAILVVLSVMEGFEVKLEERLRQQGADLIVEPKKDNKIDLIQWMLKNDSEKSEYFDAIVPIVEQDLVVQLGNKIRGLMVHAFEPKNWSNVKKNLIESIDSKLIDWENQDFPEIFLEYSFARSLGVLPGDTVKLIVPVISTGLFPELPKMKRFLITGLFENKKENQGASAFLQKKDLESLRRQELVPDFIEIEFQNKIKNFDFLKLWKKENKNLVFKDWREQNSSLFYSIQLERYAMFLVLGLIVFVASFNIVNVIYLFSLEKKNEISLIRSLGATLQEIKAIFLWKGLFLGIFGVILGLFSGILISVLLMNYPLIELPEVYVDKTLPIKIVPYYYFMVSILSFILVVLSSLKPALVVTNENHWLKGR